MSMLLNIYQVILNDFTLKFCGVLVTIRTNQTTTTYFDLSIIRYKKNVKHL